MSSRGWEHVTQADLASRQVARPRVQRPQAGRSGVGMGQAARSKFKAVKTPLHGFVFDSKREAARYGELLTLGDLGALVDLELQPRFPIIVAGIRCGSYVADFRYRRVWDGADVVEDVKSPITRQLPVYRLKVKLVAALYGVPIVEVG